MANESSGAGREAKVSRPPKRADLQRIASELNRLGVRYLVVGGFAVIEHGFPRFTHDVDLLIDTDQDNEALALQALSILSDKASLLINRGEVEKYVVVRVADEITVDLMRSGCGVDYTEAAKDHVIRDVGGVPIPFVSVRTLLRMKQTIRDKDAMDRSFLTALLAADEAQAQPPPKESLWGHIRRFFRRDP